MSSNSNCNIQLAYDYILHRIYDQEFPHASNINDAAYGCVKGTVAKSWIAAYDLEKAAHHGASSSGESLATGGILSVNLLKVGSAAASPSRAYINCLYGSVCEL